MDLLRRKLIVRGKLAVHPYKVISKTAFLSLCCVNDRVRGLSAKEAEQFLHSLCAAGTVAPLGRDVYHVRPADVVNAVHLTCGLPPLEANLPGVAAKHDAISNALQSMTDRTAALVQQATNREKEFWAVTAFLSGTQMTVLAYLTFLVWGWDVMEPVTYFVTTATALIAYGYFLYFRREHSYEHLDNVLLPRTVTQDILNSDIDVKRWLEEIQMHKELDEVTHEDQLFREFPVPPVNARN